MRNQLAQCAHGEEGERLLCIRYPAIELAADGEVGGLAPFQAGAHSSGFLPTSEEPPAH